MDCPDYSVFYYTYSTIAQTLAGAFGFLVAVVLYRIQTLTARMQQKLSSSVTAMQVAATIPMDDAERRSKEIEAAGRIPQEEEARIDRARRGLVCSLRYTSGTIIASLVALPLTPVIAGRLGICVDRVLVVLVIALAIYTIKTYYDLVIDTVMS